MSAPTLRSCVDAFCSQCRDHDPFAIGNCNRETCPLWPVRPNQILHGKTPLDFEDDDVRQEVLDALDLDEISHQVG